jgi:DNA-binding transcriptional MerR regulator
VEENLSETALCELRRVRRLMSLGVNLHGVEIIMRMRRQRIRRRIQELEAELARLQSGLRR